MADIANGTQFSDLPTCLAIDILLRLPLKALLICRYVRKDWTRLYFSDPYFIKRQLETSTSNIQFLEKDTTSEREFPFGCFVEDEVSTGNLRKETLAFSCKSLPAPKHKWRVINSCNGLVCLIDSDSSSGHYYRIATYATIDNSCTVCVCNPILGEWFSVRVPERCNCALGFTAKNNQYKILMCIEFGEVNNAKYEWEIYTLGTEHWRSIRTKENIVPFKYGLSFNTCIHGSLHWTRARGGELIVQSFDFETERFTAFSLPKPQSAIEHECVRLGVINGCLWASFYNSRQNDDGEMWAMKEYGDERSWTMMLAVRDKYSYGHSDPPDEVLRARNKECVIHKDHICYHDLLFALNGEDMLISDFCSTVKCYNIKTPKRRALVDQYIGIATAYNPSFVSLHDFWRGEQVIRGRDLYNGLIRKLADRAKKTKEEEREEAKEEEQEEKEDRRERKGKGLIKKLSKILFNKIKN